MLSTGGHGRGDGSTGGGFGAGFGGGGSGGHCVSSPSPSAAHSKQQEAGFTIPVDASASGTGMPSSNVGGLPHSAGVDSAVFASSQPGHAAVGSGMQYANTNAAEGGRGVPDYHNPVVGGVPVLPHVSAAFCSA